MIIVYIYTYIYYIWKKNIDYINGAIQYLHKTKEITEVIVTKPTKQAIRAAKSQLGKSAKRQQPSPSKEAG